MLFVDELFRIQINKKVSLKTESDKIIVSTLSNTLLQLPKDSTLYPNIEYLKYRNKTLK